MDNGTNYRIDLESIDLSKSAWLRRELLKNAKLHLDSIDSILNGHVCNVCCETIEPSEQKGEPVCFHCWLDGQTSPQFREKAVRECV